MKKNVLSESLVNELCSIYGNKSFNDLRDTILHIQNEGFDLTEIDAAHIYKLDLRDHPGVELIFEVRARMEEKE